MFRIGSLLFIPAYLSVTLYRPLGSPNDDGNVILMAGESRHWLSAIQWKLIHSVRSPRSEHVSCKYCGV